MEESLSIPQLPTPYSEALNECAIAALARYDVVAILVSGTIIRGNPDKRSDLDIHVLHRAPFRERRQEWHRGVACEVFVNPRSRIPTYFESEAASRRPMTAHMFATGVAIFDPEGVLPALQSAARESLLTPPPPDKAALIRSRYGAATTLEDALDVAERDPEAATLLLGSAVWELVKCRVVEEPGWLPRGKDLYAHFAEIDPEAARLASLAGSAGTISDRLEAGRLLAVHVTGAEGFFEWVSPREAASEDTDKE